MPFNQLLLPLIGGYLLVNFTYITSYWASRQSKEQLLLAAALGGFFALILARLLVVLLMLTELGPAMWTAIHAAAPYPGIGTALLAFAICLVLRAWINWFWPKEEAALWLYGTGTYNSLERLFFQSVLRIEQVKTRSFPAELLIRVLWHPVSRPVTYLWRRVQRRRDDLPPSDQPQRESNDELEALESNEGVLDPVPVMLSMNDRKVYVGWLEWIPPLRADGSRFLRLVPVWSGYRDSTNLKVTVTENYTVSMFEHSALPPSKVISIGDISNASLYDPDVFERFESNVASTHRAKNTDTTAKQPKKRKPSNNNFPP